MEENYQVGDFGIAKFTREKKGFKGGITAFGQIKAIESKVVLFQDDHIEYIIEKKKFSFERKESPIIVEKSQSNCL